MPQRKMEAFFFFVLDYSFRYKDKVPDFLRQCLVRSWLVEFSVPFVSVLIGRLLLRKRWLGSYASRSFSAMVRKKAMFRLKNEDEGEGF